MRDGVFVVQVGVEVKVSRWWIRGKKDGKGRIRKKRKK